MTVSFAGTTSANTSMRVQVYIHTPGVNLNVDFASLMPPWQLVDRIKPTFDWPVPDPVVAQRAQLWLRTIGRTGKPAGPAPLIVPDIRFESFFVGDNRADAVDMKLYRVTEVNDEIGGRTTATYFQKTPCSNQQAGVWPSNTQDCFPRWTTFSNSAGYGAFNRFLVQTVTRSDLVGWSVPVVTTYEYIDAPAYHRDESDLTPNGNKTWSDPRGYGSVRVTTGPGSNGTYSIERHWFFRGMHGDSNGAGGTKSVSVLYGEGSWQTDDAWLRGREYMSEVYDSSTMIERDETFYSGSVTSNFGGLVARRLDPIRTKHSSRESGGGYLLSEALTGYDAYGMPIELWDRGDIYDGTDDTCTSIQYARNTAVVNVWLVNLVGRTYRAKGTNGFPGGYSANCDEAAGSELSIVDQYYDNQAFLTALPTGAHTYTSTRPTQTAGWFGTAYTVDGVGHVTAVDGPLAGTGDTSYAFYNGDGFRWAQRDATGHTTSQDIDPGRGLARYSVDWNDGLFLSPATEGIDKVTVTDYDALGRLTAVQLPGDPNPTVRIEYSLTKTAPNWMKRRLQQTDGSWREEWTYTDGFGRVKETQTAGPNGGRLVSATEFDGRGLPVKQFADWNTTGAAGSSFATGGPFNSSVLPSETRSTYDNLGRVTETALYSFNSPVTSNSSGAPNGPAIKTTTTYDGHWMTVYPATGSPTSTHVNTLGLVDNRSDYNTTWVGAKATTYGYDLNGNLTRVTDPKANATTFTYDNLGRQTQNVDRDRGTTTTAYNNDGTIATITDATGTTLTYTSDVLGRVKEIRHNATLLESYAYDSSGEAGLLNYAASYYNGAELRVNVAGYDNRNRPTGYQYIIASIGGWTDTNGLAGTYTFDQISYRRDDQPASLRYPAIGNMAAETVTTGYSNLGVPTTLAGTTSGSLVAQTSLTNEGRVANRTYGATTDSLRIERSYGWNAATGQLASLTATQNGATLQYDTLVYDANGNLARNAHDRAGTSDDHTECYAYDGRNRLTTAYTTTNLTACSGYLAGGPAAYNYTYALDEIGNLTTSPAGAYTYPASGATSVRPHAPSTVGGSTFTWNNDGTLATKTAPTTSTYAWDQFDRLAAVTTGGATTSMIYYPGGQRALMKDTAGVHLYLDGHGERHANTVAGTNPPTTVATKTFDTSIQGFSNWYGATLSTSTTARTGTGSLQVTCPDPWCGVLDNTSPAQPVTAGMNYRLSIWSRAATTPSNVLLNAQWVDAAGNTLTTSQLRPNGVNTTSGWTNIAGDIVAPAGATRVRLGIKLDNSTSVGTQYFDDYSLTASTVTASTIATKAFESGTDGITATNQAAVTTTTLQAHGGAASLRIVPTAGGWNATDTTGIAVTAGVTYQIIGYAKVSAGWGTLNINTEWRNAANVIIQQGQVGEADMGGSWKPFVTNNLTAPTGATQLRIRFSGWTTDTWYIDDISVAAITPTSAAPTTTVTERRYYQLARTLIGARTRDTITNIDVWHYYLGDTRGSTSIAIQKGTTTTQNQWYDPYGKPRGTATITTTDRGYIGQYEDTTTNLNYLNNRYYDPTTGVFLSVDPLVNITGQPYLYGSGKPTTFSDSEGLCAGREGSRGGCGIDYYGGGNGDYGAAPSCGQGKQGLVGGFCNSYGVPGVDDSSWAEGSKYIALTACGRGCDQQYQDEMYADYGFNDQASKAGVLAGLGSFLPGIGEVIDGRDCLAGSKFSCAAIFLPFVGGRTKNLVGDVLRGAEDDFFHVSGAGANRAGTLVPESFDLSVAGQKFSVHPNATEHMAEYATSAGAGSVPMSSFAGSVETAVVRGLNPGRNFLQVGPWELGIDTNGNVIYHAVYRPGAG
ncbi:MAG: RHS repeat-associated core domain-containing protein [Actinomycetota bacterium]